LKSGYTGYRSFTYLESEVDFRPFDLGDGRYREWAYRLPLQDHEEARAERIINDFPVISLHEHVGLFPRSVADTPEYVREGRMSTAFEALALSPLDAVFDNLLNGLCQIHSPNGWKWSEVLHDLGMRLCDLGHQDFLTLCRKVEDIHAAKQSGRIAWIASIEGAAMIENEIDRIDILHGFGVRNLGITYSQSNSLGSGLKETRDGGLTALGRKAVQRMNRLGMLIDCSHASELTTLDAVEVSEVPIMLTHTGARALWDSKRLASDRVIEAVAASGGLIGIEAAPHTTISRVNRRHTLDSYMEHFQYVEKLVGIDHVSFGPDAVYGDHVGLHDLYSGSLSLKETRSGNGASGELQAERVTHVRGLENPTEAFDNIIRWLVKNGYSDDDIGKVIGGNALRVLEEVWA
jgi:membrane dipeptidase